MSGVAKVTFNGQTLIDVTDKTVTAAKMLNTGTALDKAGDSITGSIASKSSSDLTVSGATVTAPAGYYSSSASKSVASGSAGTPTASKGSVSNHSISVTPSVTNTTGYITGSTKTGTAVTVSASELVSGNKSITANGTGIDVANYSTVSVAVPTGTINNQNKTVTPTESQQSVTADTGYTGLGTVTVNAIPDEYVVPSGNKTITSSGTTDVAGYATASVDQTTIPTEASTTTPLGSINATITANASDQYLTIPKGYNDARFNYKISKIASGVVSSPVATKGAVSNNSIAITPSVTTTTGYITGGTKNGTAVTVNASELVSGTKSITSNGTGIDVTNFASVDVSVGSTILNQNKTVTPTTSQQTVTADSGYTGLGTVTVESMPTGSRGTPLKTRMKTPVLNPTQLTVRINDSSATGLTPGYFDSFSDQVNFTLENKTATPSASTQTITPTSTSYYLDSVTVNPIPSQYVVPSGNLSITSNGSYNVKNYLTATVNISGGETYTATISGNSPDPDATVIEAPDGTWYDTNGQTFSFSPGQTVTIFAYSGSGGYIYIDGSLVGNTEYAYTLPSSDVTFTFQPPSGEDDISVITSPGSLVCETGTYTPTSDIAQPTISFANTHTLPPMFIMFEDTSSTTYASDAPANTGIWWTFNDWYRMTGTGTASSSTATQYGRVQYGYRSTAGGTVASGGTVLTYNSDNTTSSSTAYPRYWATPTGFRPYTGSASRYWRAGHTYKWTAVWKP